MVSNSELVKVQKELLELQKKFSEQRTELIIAQKKRSGHYSKLEYQLEINKKLKIKIDELENTLAEKNKTFITDLVNEKYRGLDDSYQNIVELYNQEILLNNTLKADKQSLLIANSELENKYKVLNTKFKELAAEAKIAQEKRSGHYNKLVSALQRNDMLEDQIVNYKKSIDNHKYTLTWLLGEAILECKSIWGIFRLPKNIFLANRKYRNHRLGIDSQKAKVVKKDDALNTTKKEDPNIVDISILGWPLPDKDKPITIMSIADTFTTSNLKSVANLITPRPDNWKGLFYRDKPEFLFVESAWNGNNNSWQYRVGSYANPPGKELNDALDIFKSEKKPTVFWNKEDPVHFDKFKNTAKEFDYIFTSDEGSIPKYKELSQAKVLALPFAADAQLNNPIDSTDRLNRVCFAGSYYANRFIERRNDQLMLLESALPYGLDIFDRNAGNLNKDFHFPAQFDEAIKGALPYDEMNLAYKKYKVFLNVNSVIDSKTMFSRRVFELLASGTPIVSTPSKGIDEFFGNDLVWTVKNKDEAQEAIYTLLNDDKEWRRRSIQGIRSVFSQHTFEDRFQFVLETVGLKLEEGNIPKILCCFEVKNESDIDFMKRVIGRQITNNKFSLVPFVVLKNKELKVDTPYVIGDSSNLGAIIRSYIQQKNDIQFVSVFSSQLVYGKFYLLDQYLSTLYSNAEIITKPESNIDSYEYVNTYLKNGALFRSDLFKDDVFLKNFNSRNNIQKAKNLLVFSIDSANFAIKKESSIDKTLIQIEI